MIPAVAARETGALMLRLARFPEERGDATAELDMMVSQAAWMIDARCLTRLAAPRMGFVKKNVKDCI
jgi:hypothetical protein